MQNGAERVSGKPKERQGKVLFINADREFLQGRAQNFLMPEHIEKIVTTFEAYKEEPGFSAIVDTATLKASGYNLNIRRYADNARHRPSRMTCAPICWVASPRPKSRIPARRPCSTRTA